MPQTTREEMKPDKIHGHLLACEPDSRPQPSVTDFVDLVARLLAQGQLRGNPDKFDDNGQGGGLSVEHAAKREAIPEGKR